MESVEDEKTCNHKENGETVLRRLLMLALAREASSATLQRKRELRRCQEQLYQQQLFCIGAIKKKKEEKKMQLSLHEKLLCSLQETLHTIYEDLRRYECHT